MKFAPITGEWERAVQKTDVSNQLNFTFRGCFHFVTSAETQLLSVHLLLILSYHGTLAQHNELKSIGDRIPHWYKCFFVTFCNIISDRKLLHSGNCNLTFVFEESRLNSIERGGKKQHTYTFISFLTQYSLPELADVT